jgi:protein-tyrosine-phosphatase
VADNEIKSTGQPDPERPVRVLFVCTGNSARSIFAESLLRRVGGEDFEVFSAGTEPRGVNPMTLEILEQGEYPTESLRSKSVQQFLGQEFDYVITVCDNARESCPVFPGAHESLHWGYDDPAAVEGTDEERRDAFRKTFVAMGERINQFATLVRRQRREAAQAARTEAGQAAARS